MTKIWWSVIRGKLYARSEVETSIWLMQRHGNRFVRVVDMCFRDTIHEGSEGRYP